MKKRISLLASLILLLTASAGASIAPTLPPADYPVAGEADMGYNMNSSPLTAYVDWIVEYRSSDNVYIYLYQLENWIDDCGPISSFFIEPTAAILDYGWAGMGVSGMIDLDSTLSGLSDFDKNHNSGDYANLAGEHEIDQAGLAPISSASLSSVAGGWSVLWDFESGYGLYGGDESDVMWIASRLGPAYTPAYATFGDHTLSGCVPAPQSAVIPEPASMALFGLGLFGFIARKKYKG